MSVIVSDVMVIGAGAAGLMCAIEAGKRGRSVCVIEHNDAVAKKIRISGGGRCNFTNIHASPADFLSGNPHFCKSALSRYTPADFVKLVESHRIAYHEKKLGQLFCDGSAQEIIDMLLEESRKACVRLFLKTSVEEISRNDRFVVKTSGPMFQASSLVMACGGLSIPSIGATDLGYRIARQFGLKLIAPRPGLVPLTAEAGELEMFRSLSGVSADSRVSVGKTQFRENVLFTHRGMSGPAILQISSYWKPGEAVVVDFLPDIDLRREFETAKASSARVSTVVKRFLPERLTDALLKGWEDLPLAHVSVRHQAEIERRLKAYRFFPQGTEGYAKAEVTLGGVDTAELSSQTMEVRSVPGLYFIGEAVDVTGHLGGYNFQWAWASGYAAGQAV